MTGGRSAGSATKVQEGPPEMQALGHESSPGLIEHRQSDAPVSQASGDTPLPCPQAPALASGAAQIQRAQLVASLTNAMATAVAAGDLQAARILHDAIGRL